MVTKVDVIVAGHTCLDVIPPLPEYDNIREFFPHHHPPRPMAPPAEESTGEYPHTLDLRRPPQA